VKQSEIARAVGVGRQTVSRWFAVWETDGRAGLKRRPKTGRPCRLDEDQWTMLAGMLARGALAAGFDTERWTLPRIALVVERELGIQYHCRSLGRVLRAHGWSPPRPATQARERNEALIEAWLKRDWPRIKKGLVGAGGSLPSWTKRVSRFGPV
jgi:transposase